MIRRNTLETALRTIAADASAVTPAELIEIAYHLEQDVSHRFSDLAAALRAAAHDMDHPVSAEDVLASYDAGRLRSTTAQATEYLAIYTGPGRADHRHLPGPRSGLRNLALARRLVVRRWAHRS